MGRRAEHSILCFENYRAKKVAVLTAVLFDLAILSVCVDENFDLPYLVKIHLSSFPRDIIKFFALVQIQKSNPSFLYFFATTFRNALPIPIP